MDQPFSLMLSETPPSVHTPNISTEQIQKTLEENHQLIMLILESQSLGRQNEREVLTNRLQRNLLFLTELADSMTQSPSPSPQIPPPQMLTDPLKQQGYWPHHREPAQAIVPSSARQPQVQPNNDHQQPYFLYQQYFPESQNLDMSAGMDTQLVAGNVSSHNMFHVMRSDQDR